METIYESGTIKIIECVDSDGEVQRQLFLGPPFDKLQGAVKTARPTFHVHDYTKNLTYGAMCVPEGIKNALFLGLGAGITIRAVREMFPCAEIDIVDSNRELFEISDRFFFKLADSDRVKWFAEDAFDFVRTNNKHYDYVCCDIWGNDLGTPKFLADSAFLKRVKDITDELGVFAMNTQWFLHKQLSEALVRQFQFVFSAKGFNCLLLAMNFHPRLINDSQVLKQMMASNLVINEIQDNLVLIRSAWAERFN